MEPVTAPKISKGMKITIVVIVVIVIIIIAGTAYYFYDKKKKESDKKTDAPATTKTADVLESLAM